MSEASLTPQVTGGPAPRAEAMPWSLTKRIAFRFCFLYFTLYVVAAQMLGSLFPFVDFTELGTLRYPRAVVEWVAKHFFRVTAQLVVTDSGSGDKTFDWVQTFCILILAIVGTAVWSLLRRGPKNYSKLYAWFRVFIRFSLAATMLTYALFKVVPLQMNFPRLARLLEPYGNFSPMGVLWASIGASKAYEIITGCAELAGGIFLFSPRTTTFGALICLADTIEVFSLNMTYDVPVKLFAFHLILLAVFLLAPDARRLANVFFLNRPVAPSAETPLFRGARANRIALAAQILFGVALVGMNFYASMQEYKTFGEGAPKSPLYGIWNVEDFSLDGQPHPPLLTDAERWRRLVFEFPKFMTLQHMDEANTLYGATIDMKAGSVALMKSSDKNWKAAFSFSQPATGKLILDGEMDGHKIHAQLELFDRSKFLLVKGGFHWIQEFPVNR